MQLFLVLCPGKLSMQADLVAPCPGKLSGRSRGAGLSRGGQANCLGRQPDRFVSSPTWFQECAFLYGPYMAWRKEAHVFL